MGIDLKMEPITNKSKFSQKKKDIAKVKNKVSIDSMILILIPYLLVI